MSAADKMAEALRIVVGQGWNSTRAETHDLWRRQQSMFKAANLALAAYEAEKAQPAPEPLKGTPRRDEYVKMARTFALAYGLHEDAPAYLPRTKEEADNFAPHGWVIAAMMQAFGEGWADGHAGGIEFMKIAAGRADAHPAPEPDDAQVKAAAIAAGLYPDDHELSASELMHLSAFARQFAVGRADAQPADREDAERYRWLRNYPNNINPAIYGPTGGLLRRDDYLDKAIDAAMLAARAEKGGK